MAVRYEVEHVVQESLPVTITYLGAPVSRRVFSVITVTVNATILDLSGNPLTLYTGETGGSTTANPTTANSTTGAIDAWVAAPDYDIAVSGTNITSYTQKVRQSPQGIYNVKSYGAKSDGSTNDLTTVQTAITAAGTAGAGNTVHFPNTGTYVVTGSITVPNNNAIYITGTPPAALAFPSKASAGSFILPPNAGGVTVTGTTSITSIGAWPAGKMVVLTFTGALTVTDGSNLVLAGNFVTTAGDTITLISDGTNWIEVARSVN